MNVLKYWLKFLKSRTEEEVSISAERRPELQRAYDKLAYLSQDESTREIYYSKIRLIRDEISLIEGEKLEGVMETEIKVAKNALLNYSYR